MILNLSKDPLLLISKRIERNSETFIFLDFAQYMYLLHSHFYKILCNCIPSHKILLLRVNIHKFLKMFCISFPNNFTVTFLKYTSCLQSQKVNFSQLSQYKSKSCSGNIVSAKVFKEMSEEVLSKFSHSLRKKEISLLQEENHSNNRNCAMLFPFHDITKIYVDIFNLPADKDLE